MFLVGETDVTFNEMELHCFARKLQVLFNLNPCKDYRGMSFLDGCDYCKYQDECMEQRCTTQKPNENKLVVERLVKKLEKYTGVKIRNLLSSIPAELTFLENSYQMEKPEKYKEMYEELREKLSQRDYEEKIERLKIQQPYEYYYLKGLMNGRLP